MGKAVTQAAFSSKAWPIMAQLSLRTVWNAASVHTSAIVYGIFICPSSIFSRNWYILFFECKKACSRGAGQQRKLARFTRGSKLWKRNEPMEMNGASTGVGVSKGMKLLRKPRVEAA